MSIFTNKTEANVPELQEASVKQSPYEAVAFLNVDAILNVGGEELRFKPTGARFTRKWVDENPKMWEALQLVDEPHTKFECDFIIIKGDELRRIEMDKMEANLSEDMKAILSIARAGSAQQEYTNYVRVVGDLYLKTKKGKIKLNGVFPPSFDFRIGLEGKYIENQVHLVEAALNNKTVEWESRSMEFIKDKEEVDFELEDLL